MSTIDTNLLFSSDWDIDQLILPDPIVINIPIAASPDGGTTAATATATYSHNLGYLPVIEASYQAGGQSTWHQCGLPDGYILANWSIQDFFGNEYYPGMVSTQGMTVAYGFDTENIYFTALNYYNAQTLIVRLHLWADKVDY